MTNPKRIELLLFVSPEGILPIMEDFHGKNLSWQELKQLEKTLTSLAKIVKKMREAKEADRMLKFLDLLNQTLTNSPSYQFNALDEQSRDLVLAERANAV